MLTIKENEKLEIRHQSQGCFHYYEDVFEIFGNAPLSLQVYRLHPNGKTNELDVAETRGTVDLTETDLNALSDFVTQYRNISLQKDTRSTGFDSTTEDIIRVRWYRDGEIVEEIKTDVNGGTFPVLRGIFSRAK